MTLYNGDCTEVMQNLINQGVKVDAIITDPPYYVQAQGCGGGVNKWNGRSRFKGGNSVFGKKESKNRLFEYLHPSQYMNYLSEILKDDGHLYLFSNDKNLAETIMIAEANNFKLMNILVVNKLQGTYFSYYQKYCEFILFFRNTKGKAKYINNCGMGNYFEHRFTRGKNKLHPSEKPIELMEKLILQSSNEGETVLDFTMGSGTTGVACKKLNRNFIGIELDEKYFEIAKERIGKHQVQAIFKESEQE